MSAWKRGLALTGTILALTTGPALLTSAPAAAAPTTASSSVAAGQWSYQGYYYGDAAGYNACKRDGQASSRRYECRYYASGWQGSPKYELWIWIG
ncbi:hypothetical protein [Streptosporangium pseudovulgare]|uniref:Lactococcin 972 family bacteriocin n=1 Tax=Streptosporangium pseudovulgare TaxID=35765 RepID=A0ABQ2QGB3_9ACTN|nr:hypothetical protein [Streptosporangium pseudovulgare]GGP78205.1 hypothetical protein GCM10010140_02970 [Streptosporangium pseudovulgare]